MSTTTVEPEKGLARLDEGTVLSPQHLRGWAERMVPQLEVALPPALRESAARFARSLVTEVQRNPNLKNTTALSLLGAMIQTAQLGLELGGPLGQAYLVPYWNSKVKANEVQMQVGYRGLLALGHRSGQIATMYAQVVYERDEFDLQLGSEPRVTHKPALTPDRGRPLGVYAVVVKIKSDRPDVEWMSAAEIEKHKDQYSKAAGKGFSPWSTAWNEMARKTVLRRLAKRTPVSVELVTAAVLDEHADDDVPQNLRSLAADALAIELPEPRSETAESVAERLGEAK